LPKYLDLSGPLLASAALVFAAGCCLAGGPASAGFYDYPFDALTSPNPIRTDLAASPRPAKPKPASDIRDAKATKPASRDSGRMPKGPLQIVVSIADQRVTLYSDGARIAQGPVSTGVVGRPTPTGVFSIIQKDRYHHSNLYSNAPMPYMERITWSGVALHEGPLPGYPASHGCIRLSHEFAVRLWAVAKLGARVVVARNEIVPTEFSDPHLFEPKPKGLEPKPAETSSVEPSSDEPKTAEPKTAGPDPEKPAEANARISYAQAVGSQANARIAGGTPAGGPVGPGPASAENGLRGPIEPGGPAAAASVRPAAPAKAAAGVDAADKNPPQTPPRAPTASEPVKRAGTVAVFISRKEKKIYVRQGFEPLFDMPVEIENPEQPFGTHVFTALGLSEDGTHMRWNLMSIAEPQRRQSVIGPNGKTQASSRVVQSYPSQTAAQVLDRIQIPQEAIDRIDEILSPGSSLVVSDQGLGPETGEGTDFVVLTR